MNINPAVTLVEVPTPSQDPEVLSLIGALNDRLKAITGSDGQANAALADFEVPGATFLVARQGRHAVGCGGLRPSEAGFCEIKRMFVLCERQGIGSRILQGLEKAARDHGYRGICLETRTANDAAVRFYLAHGYRVAENYGIYKDRQDAVCFRRTL